MRLCILLALAEKISALLTQEYIETRAKRGSRKKFERAVKRVPRTALADFDRI